MKVSKKFLSITSIIFIVIIPLITNCYAATRISLNFRQGSLVKVGLFSKDLNDDYIALLRKDFEEIQKNNLGKVSFSFYDAKFNKSTQSSDIDNLLKTGVDLILLDIVDVNDLEELINKIAQYNVPVIVFNREPLTMDAIKSYKRALYVGTDSKQAGILQGKMIVDAWNNHKAAIDKDKDNILQYIMLIGERLNKTSINRTTFSISTIERAGIKTQELASPVLNWDTEAAENTVSALLLKYAGKVEAIISNDDSMAVGAVRALQKYGYNTGNKSKLIPVVGVDGDPDARELILKGFMLGSSLQDPTDMANAIYAIGMNLVNERNPVEGTPYQLDETGVAVHLPYQEYTGPMFQ